MRGEGEGEGELKCSLSTSHPTPAWCLHPCPLFTAITTIHTICSTQLIWVVCWCDSWQHRERLKRNAQAQRPLRVRLSSCLDVGEGLPLPLRLRFVGAGERDEYRMPAAGAEEREGRAEGGGGTTALALRDAIREAREETTAG